MLGGIAVLLHIPWWVVAGPFVVVGLVLAALRLRRLELHRPFPRSVVVLGCCGVAALGLVAVLEALAGFRFPLHPWDDMRAYLPLAHRLIDTNALVDPWNARRLQNLGGFTFLQAMPVAIFGNQGTRRGRDDALEHLHRRVVRRQRVPLNVGPSRERALHSRDPAALGAADQHHGCAHGQSVAGWCAGDHGRAASRAARRTNEPSRGALGRRRRLCSRPRCLSVRPNLGLLAVGFLVAGVLLASGSKILDRVRALVIAGAAALVALAPVVARVVANGAHATLPRLHREPERRGRPSPRGRERHRDRRQGVRAPACRAVPVDGARDRSHRARRSEGVARRARSCHQRGCHWTASWLRSRCRATAWVGSRSCGTSRR